MAGHIHRKILETWSEKTSVNKLSSYENMYSTIAEKISEELMEIQSNLLKHLPD